MSKSQTLSVKQSQTDEYVEQIRRDGYCVVEGMVGADDLDRVRDDAIRVTHKDKRYQPELGGIAVAQDLINSSQVFAPFLVSPPLIAVIKALLGPLPRVNSASALVSYPSNQQGDWHTDWPYSDEFSEFMPTPYPDMTMHLSTLWMLTPFNSVTGGTRIIPGSHRWGDSPHHRENFDPFSTHPDEVQVEGEGGSALVWDTRAWHAIASNRSDEPRVAIAARYMPWWLNSNAQVNDSAERLSMMGETGRTDGFTRVKAEVFEALPDDVQSMFVNNIESK